MTKKKSQKITLTNNAVVRYLRETRQELRKVRWPSRQEAWNLTKIVLGVTIAMALFLGVMDYLFSLELQGLIRSNELAIGIAIVMVMGTVAATVVLNRQRA